MDRTLAIRVDDFFYRQIKLRLAENGMSLKDYVIHLIQSDLKDNNPLNLADIPVDYTISAESVREAQKVLDFVNNILIMRKPEKQ